MTGAQLTAEIRRRTGTSSATLSDATLLPIVNFTKDAICSRITEKDENYFVIPATQNLVASDIDAREYALPDDVLNNLVSVECAFSTTTPLAYVLARQTTYTAALKVTGGLTENNITNSYDNTTPYFFIQRRSLYMLSGTISAVTAGLKIRYRAYPPDLTVLTGTTALELDPTTTSFGVPRQFHLLWAMKCAIEWKNNRPKPIPLSEDEKKWEDEMQNRLAEMKKVSLSEEILGLLPQTSREGSFGYDL